MSRWLACVALLACASPAFAQGRLARARSSMRGLPVQPRPSASEAHVWNDILQGASGGGDPRALLVAAGVAGAVATSPVWVPMALFDDNPLQTASFPGHPYADDRIRYLDIGERPPQRDMDWFDPEYYKPWGMRLAVENGNDFNGLDRVGGRFTFDTSYRIGVMCNWDYFREQLPGAHVDDALMGEINLTYRFVQADWAQMYLGAGTRLMTDRFDTFGGFNFVYGADIFPIDPLVISAQVDLGNLHDAFVVRGRVTVGWQIQHLELLAGYDFLRIGSANLQGPMLGARLWF